MRFRLPATLFFAVALAHCGLDIVGVYEAPVAVTNDAGTGARDAAPSQVEPDADVVSPPADAALPILRFLPSGTPQFTAESAPVNLTTEGTADWSMWGLAGTTVQRHKQLSRSLISDLDRTSSITPTSTKYMWPVDVTWTDGEDDDGGVTGNTNEFIYSTQHFSFTVIASAKPQKLTLHVGAYTANTQLTATMNGAMIVATLDNALAFQGDFIALELASPTNATVAIDFVVESPIPDGGAGAVDLIAVTLGDE